MDKCWSKSWLPGSVRQRFSFIDDRHGFELGGSDLKMYDGSDFYWGDNGRARRGVIPGHEFVGSVVEIDPTIAREQSIAVGDVVVAEQLLACRDRCWFCKNGMEHKCDQLVIYGQGVDGSMAEYMIYQKGSWLHKVPKEISPIYAVLAEPVAVSVRAVDRADLQPTDLVRSFSRKRTTSHRSFLGGHLRVRNDWLGRTCCDRNLSSRCLRDSSRLPTI